MDSPKDTAVKALTAAGFATTDQNGVLMIETYEPKEQKQVLKILKESGYNRSYGFWPKR